mgnify:CR=1 FL=1
MSEVDCHHHSHDHEYQHKGQEALKKAEFRNNVCLLETDPKFQKKVMQGNKAFNKLLFVVIICFLFMIVEIVGGALSGSLAILSDAAHMLSDVAGFAISMISIWIGQRNPNHTFTWGYHRCEVLGALTSVVMIWAMIGWLCIEATDRILNKHDNEIDAKIMLITSFISLACNIFNLIALDHFPLLCFKKKKKNDDEEEANFMDSIMSIYKPHGGHSCSGHHHGHGHDHHHHEHDHHHHGHHHHHNHDHDHGHDVEKELHTHKCGGHAHTHENDEEETNLFFDEE